jgi:hypothetical protein
MLAARLRYLAERLTETMILGLEGEIAERDDANQALPPI